MKTVTAEPYHSATFMERIAISMVGNVLWPLSSDERMTILLSLLGGEISDAADSEADIDRTIDAMRLYLKTVYRIEHGGPPH